MAWPRVLQIFQKSRSHHGNFKRFVYKERKLLNNNAEDIRSHREKCSRPLFADPSGHKSVERQFLGAWSHIQVVVWIYINGVVRTGL